MAPLTRLRRRDLATPDRAVAGATEAISAHSIADVDVRAVDVVKVHGHGPSAVRALDGVSVEFARAAFTAIMGPSGSGKSTLMHCLAGLDSLTSGQAWIGKYDLASMSDGARTRLRREHIGFVFQSFNLLAMLTAKQNILLPFDLAGTDPDWDWFDAVVDVLGIGSRLSHRPATLSGGEQQRVAVARALVTRPDVVFADEPTGNLDSTASGELLDFLRTSVRELAQTVVIVTHDAGAAARADRAVLLADGHLAGDLIRPTVEQLVAATGRRGR